MDETEGTEGFKTPPEQITSDVEVNNETNIPEIVGEVIHVEIDTRRKEWVCAPVERNELIHAIEKDHEEDCLKTIRRIGRPKSGLFKLQSTDYSRYVNKTIKVRDVDIPLNLVYREERRFHTRTTRALNRVDKSEEGLLVTIFNAYEIQHRHIQHEEFDEFFMSIDGVEVIDQTRPQFNGGTRTLNGHRSVKLKNITTDGTKIDLGTHVEVHGTRFKIIYDGLETMCFVCGSKHGKECPLKIRFNELKQLRRNQTTKRKIYSDSFLRK